MCKNFLTQNIVSDGINQATEIVYEWVMDLDHGNLIILRNV